MKDIKWFANRLKSMNIPEVAWRVQQKVLQKTEYKKFFIIHKPVTEIPISKELESLSPQIDRLGINWGNGNFSLFEEIDLFGVYDYKKSKKQWNAGFQTDNMWPVNDFSYRIAISQRDDIGDIRTNWELNRHFQFVGLAKNYYITGDVKYLYELKELFDDWNRNNLFLHGVQWTSPMEMAIRIISWTYMYAFIEKASNGERKEFLNSIAHGIKVMSDYIIKHRARYSSANNHLIIEMTSIGVSGIFLGYNKWIKYAVKVLTEELPKQNYSDGVNKEMSLHYQSFVMEAYGVMWILMKKNNIQLPEMWNIYLTHMSEFVADCCGDFGEVIVFGDNDEGKIMDFSGKIDDYYRYVLQLMGLLLEKKYTSKKLIENLYWIADEDTIKSYEKKKIYKPELVSSYKEGGYTVLRSSDHKVLIGFDHAELGYGSIAAHGHADALSIQIFYEGNPVLVDVGTYNYHVSKKVRNKMRSTKNHNTVYVEGKEQAEMIGAFLWGKRYTIGPYSITVKKEVVEIVGEINYFGIKHMREIEFNFDNKIIVRDKVLGTDNSNQIWNIATCNQPKEIGGQIIAENIRICQNGLIKSCLYSNLYNQYKEAALVSIPINDGEVETIIFIGENK